MNAVFQQLFMVPGVRSALLAEAEEPAGARKESVFYHMQVASCYTFTIRLHAATAACPVQCILSLGSAGMQAFRICSVHWCHVADPLCLASSVLACRSAAVPALRALLRLPLVPQSFSAACQLADMHSCGPAPILTSCSATALQSTFVHLALSRQQAFKPVGIWHAFKDYDGEPVNVREHQDAQEFLTRLQVHDGDMLGDHHCTCCLSWPVAAPGYAEGEQVASC